MLAKAPVHHFSGNNVSDCDQIFGISMEWGPDLVLDRLLP